MSLYEQWVKTLEQIELKPISDDKACKILAWVYYFGGQYEVNYNVKLKTDIEYAQRRLNIFGSETLNAELCQELKQRIKEIENKSADWLEDIKIFYELPDYAVRY